jgi:putative membrane protein
MQAGDAEGGVNMDKRFITLGILAAAGIFTAPTPSRGADSARPIGPADVHQGGTQGTLSSKDQTTVKESLIMSMSSVKMGKMATTKSTRADLKKYGQKMVDDHTKLVDKLNELGKRKGMTPPTDIDEDHMKMIDELGKLSGNDFDKKYVSMELDEHQKFVDKFKDVQKSADDAELKSLAAKSLPTLQEHLTSLQAIDAKMKSGTTPKK